MPRVCILPTLSEYGNRSWGGVLRLVEALYKYAPMYGWDTTDNPDNADVVHTLGMKEHSKSKIYTCLGFWENKTVPEYYNAQRKIERLAQQAEVFTVLSQWSKEFFKDRLGVTAEVIPNGADYVAMQSIKPIPGYLSDFLWAKAGTYYPNCNYGSTPVVGLAKEMPNHTFMLTFARSDERHGLRNVVLTGQLAFSDMLRTIAGCKVYISTVKETFGAQTIEAMAMGKPVLAYDFGGNSEILTHKVDGYLVKPGDNLLEGAEYILANYEAMSKRAKITAMRYDWKIIVPKYVRLWERVL